MAAIAWTVLQAGGYALRVAPAGATRDALNLLMMNQLLQAGMDGTGEEGRGVCFVCLCPGRVWRHSP